MKGDKGHSTEQGISIVHCVGPDGDPQCPRCGKWLESEGGSVHKGGSWDWGPFYWYCEDCDFTWGHA